MADSPPITVTLAEAVMPTELSMWDLNPKSGSLPLVITWLGYLSIPGYSANTPTYSFLNGEQVQLQVEMFVEVPVGPPSSQWIDIPGATAITGYNSSTGYYGYFSGTYTVPNTWAAGTYRFRVHYNGSVSKGLAGCEPEVALASDPWKEADVYNY